MSIEKNVGRIDSVIRIVLGIVLLLVVSPVFPGPKTGWAYLGLIGLIPLVTGILGFCPLYQLLGINTRKRQEGDDMDDKKLIVKYDAPINCLKTMNNCLKFLTRVFDHMIEQMELGCGRKRYIMDVEVFRPPPLRETMEQLDNIFREERP